MTGKRTAVIERKTAETEIKLKIDLDGNGKCEIDTGIGFFDHMLELFSHHSGVDLEIKCRGDLDVDGHHTVEDVGISLGKAVYTALGDKRGIERYGCIYLPMDESLCRTAIDLSGRPYLSFNAAFNSIEGGFDFTLVKEFFSALTAYGFLTAHIDLLRGENDHHRAEAVFKSFARAFKTAIKVVGEGIPSSKGIIE